jgi:hypothetical protein
VRRLRQGPQYREISRGESPLRMSVLPSLGLPLIIDSTRNNSNNGFTIDTSDASSTGVRSAGSGR